MPSDLLRPLAVYVHIPFCTIKCGYCDFNAYAGMDRLKPAYADALLREIDWWASELPGREVASIAFGGGTPGEMSPAAIADVIDRIAIRLRLSSTAEVSLEANPGTTDGMALRELKAAGVNRVSFGAQSFRSDELRLLDRIHSPEAITGAVHAARDAGIASIGLDLLYGLPGQSPGDWQSNVNRAIELEPDHISCYALTVEEGTALAARIAGGTVVMPSGDEVADAYDWAGVRLSEAGFEHYEISNWARPGHRSRHNQVYWTDGDYLGVGAGAHGYLDGRRYENIAHPRAYIAQVAEGEGSAIAEWHELSPATVMTDWLSLRLRLIEGFPLDEFSAHFGANARARVAPAIGELVSLGMLEQEHDRLRLSRRGHLLHSEVAVRLYLYLDQAAPGSA